MVEGEPREGSAHHIRMRSADVDDSALVGYCHDAKAPQFRHALGWPQPCSNLVVLVLTHMRKNCGTATSIMRQDMFHTVVLGTVT